VKYFLLFLLFVTIWVIVICGFLYLSRRSAAVWTARRHRPDASGRCCREVPCSDECARDYQRQRDRLAIQYDRVANELGKIVQAGRELEPASGLPGLPDE
jgi:hypothetical protein